jgi:hypothetical protein
MVFTAKSAAKLTTGHSDGLFINNDGIFNINTALNLSNGFYEIWL